MAFLDEIAARLVSQGVGIIGTSIFLGSRASIPTGSGPYISLTETGGTGSVRTQNQTGIERPTAQVLSRATNYNTARTMLKNAYNALGGVNGLHNITLSSTFYLSVTARQNITDIGLDTAGRVMLVFNIDAEKQPS